MIYMIPGSLNLPLITTIVGGNYEIRSFRQLHDYVMTTIMYL